MEFAERLRRATTRRKRKTGLRTAVRSAPTAESVWPPLKALAAAMVVGTLMSTTIFVALWGRRTIQTAQ